MTKIMINGKYINVKDGDYIVVKELPKVLYDRNSETYQVIFHNGKKLE